jgi:hypothetical protein
VRGTVDADDDPALAGVVACRHPRSSLLDLRLPPKSSQPGDAGRPQVVVRPGHDDSTRAAADETG